MSSENKLSLSSSDLLWKESFSEIQCYNDDQVKAVIDRLVSDSQFSSSLIALFSKAHTLLDHLPELAEIETIEGFQTWIEHRIIPLINTTHQALSISGLDLLDKKQNYIFISNHRDIVMDPLLLNQALRKNGFSTAHCAIGDNLLKHPSANDLALLNRCFKVFRSLKSPRAMLNAMKNQSAYIQYLHFNLKENIWIAQKEGRAKDNIDKTNPALIKMLGLCKPKNDALEHYLDALNIVPVSFSYEWDPCDVDKASELSIQEGDQSYQKQAMDDLIATQKGLKGNKGHIHLHFGNVIKASEHISLDHKSVAEEIDRVIQQNYKTYPVNYAAYKKINGVSFDPCPYEKQDVNLAIKKLEKRVEGIPENVAKKVYLAYSQALR